MITNVILGVAYILHITAAAYIRHPRSEDLYFTQQELNPEISWNYGDSFNFNYPSVPISNHNSIEKPVDEPQEYVPPQSIGAASVPLLPPPAIPVNAAASNVPSTNGAVYLGSGSIGVVSLGNGAFALGSGSLGYSDGRGQPRPSTNVPVYPRLPPSRNLIPAAVPSQPSAQPPQMYPGFQYTFPDINNHIQDPNSYEVLRPDSVRFGTPVIRPPRPLRMHFATPTVPVQAPNPQYTLQINPQIPQSNPTQPQQQYYMRQM